MKPGKSVFVMLLAALWVGGCGKSGEIERLSNEGFQAASQRNYPKAVDRWTEVLRLDPKNRQAYFQRAAAYETAGDAKLALEDYAAYAEVGDFERAVACQKQVLELVKEQDEKRSQLLERLSLYQQGKPYREVAPN